MSLFDSMLAVLALVGLPKAFRSDLDHDKLSVDSERLTQFLIVVNETRSDLVRIDDSMPRDAAGSRYFWSEVGTVKEVSWDEAFTLVYMGPESRQRLWCNVIKPRAVLLS